MVFKSNWEKIPFVRIALLVTAGIVCGRYAPAGAVYAGSFAVAVLAYLYLHRLVLRNPGKTNLLYIVVTACAYAAFFSFGALRMWQVEPRERLSLYAPDSLVQAYEARIVSRADRKANGNSSLTAQILRIRTPEGWQPADAQVQLTIQADSLPRQSLVYGSRLLISGKPQLIEPPKNPDAFDYKRLMRNKGIVYQHFVKADQWQIRADEVGFSLRGIALRLQKWADRMLEQAINSPMEAGLASALIVGLKDDLDDTLLRAYSATGIMHVLAVSGLHVGILFTILSFLLRPLKNHVQEKYAFVGIVLVMLWGYALVTGLSPSVMRAALMFSLLNVAQLFGRRNSSFNTLALSAVILLTINPLMLFQVGFQLSYAAVAGIMYFYPRFYRLCEFRHWLPDSVWQIMCVSAAAQLATFPLGMYYFHQFPNYFLLSNLFAIPLAFFILCGGITILAFSWNSFLASCIGWAVKQAVGLNNYLAFAVESLPYAAAKALYVNGWEMFCIYAIICSLAVFFVVKRRVWLVFSLTFAAFFSFSKMNAWWRQRHERLFAVFHTPQRASMLWLMQRRGILLADSVMLAQPKQIRYAFADFLVKRGIYWEELPLARIDSPSDWVAVRQVPGGFLYRKDGLQVFRLHWRLGNFAPPPCDVLLIGNNALRSLQSLPQEFLQKVRHIVIENTNSLQNARNLQAESARMGLSCHVVALDGAFLLKY